MTSKKSAWVCRAIETTADAHAVECDLVAEDGTVIAGCLWADGELDIDSDGCGLSSEGRALGLTLDDIDWPSESEAVEAAHGEERWCILNEEGGDYDRVWATPDEALEIAVDNVDRANYDGDEEQILKPLFLHVAVYSDLDGRRRLERSQTVLLDGEEPPCPDGGHGEHDWSEDYLRGKGGGVVEHEICRLCGAGRLVDSWAQDPETGDQGWTTTSYEAPGTHEVEPLLTDYGVALEGGGDLDVPSDETPEEDESPSDYLARLVKYTIAEIKGNAAFADADGWLPAEIEVRSSWSSDAIASAWVEDQTGERDERWLVVTEYDQPPYDEEDE